MKEIQAVCLIKQIIENYDDSIKGIQNLPIDESDIEAFNFAIQALMNDISEKKNPKKRNGKKNV